MKGRWFYRLPQTVVLALFLLFFINVNNLKSQEGGRLSLKKLTNFSTDIVKVEVTNLRSFWNRSRTRIITEINISVLDNIKGELKKGEAISYKRLGGTVEGISMLVLHAPGYETGQKSILFLEKGRTKDGKDHYMPFGIYQNKFDITLDKNTNQELVFRENITSPLKLQTGEPEVNVSKANPHPLSDFVAHIKRFANRKKGERE